MIQPSESASWSRCRHLDAVAHGRAGTGGASDVWAARRSQEGRKGCRGLGVLGS